jgi:NAD(P)-dependent dehydrogenase (short-subunit alcohol dehydrogenase family)
VEELMRLSETGELDGQVAIVTGAGAQSCGIGNGRATSVLLARAGAKVVLVDRDTARLRETAARIDEFGGSSICVAADVSLEDDCRRAVAEAVDTWGRLDILVNNVGVVGPSESVVDVDVEQWTATFAINVTSVMLMSRFAIPPMRKRGAGSIVNVSSLAGVLSSPAGVCGDEGSHPQLDPVDGKPARPRGHTNQFGVAGCRVHPDGAS